MRIRIVVEYDAVTGDYAVYCPELPGCASAGDTEEEALVNIVEAASLHLEPVPLELAPNQHLTELEITV